MNYIIAGELIVTWPFRVYWKCEGGHNGNNWQGLLSLMEFDLIYFFFFSSSASLEFGNLDESSLVQTSGSDLSAEDRELLKAYHHSFDDEKVDLDLIMHLLYNICHSCEAGKWVLSKRTGTKIYSLI